MERKFENLYVWQKSKDLVIETYKLLNKFPDIEKYAMSSQLRRSAVSVCANIAEGSGRRTDKDFLQFLYIAKGSLEETKSYIIIAKDLNYINVNDLNLFLDKINEIGKMLGSLIRTITNEINASKTSK